jgi:Domain of unknown function (DUF4258)
MTDNRLSPEQAQEQIRSIAKFGFITPTGHCLHESMAERNYDIQDLELVLTSGFVKDEPEWDSDYANWKYKVEGKTTEGDEAVVVTVILSHNELLAITMMSK